MSNNLLKLLLAIGGQGANNIQISVAATKGIQKLLGFIYVAKSYAVNQLEKTAHIHGAYANKLVKGGVLLKNVVEKIGKINIFGDGDFKLTLGGFCRAKPDKGVEKG